MLSFYYNTSHKAIGDKTKLTLRRLQMKLEFHDLAAVTDNTTNIMIGGELLTVNNSHKNLKFYTQEMLLVLKSAILYVS